jgi:predicted phage terminase large subunit-like protein
MKTDKESEQWVILSLPSIWEGPTEFTIPEDKRELGEALWPYKYSAEKLLQAKKTMGSYLFSAMHQQKPAPPEGGILKRTWWKRYKELPGRFDEIIQSWDCAFKDTAASDYVVGQVWGRIGPDKYLLDQVRDKMNFPQTIHAVERLTKKWPQAYKKLIEDKANGPAVISTLNTKINGLIPVNPEGGKTARAQAVSGDIEAGNIYIPDSSIAYWVDDFIEECASFPNGSHDDQVDAMSQALARLITTCSADTEIRSLGRRSDIIRGFTSFNIRDLKRYY